MVTELSRVMQWKDRVSVTSDFYHDENDLILSKTLFFKIVGGCSKSDLRSSPFYALDHEMSGALCHGLCVGVRKHLVSVNYRTNARVYGSDFSVAYWG
jgi:hypothetical protein